MVRIERTKTPPESLAREAKKVHGSYEGKDVVQQLKQDFHIQVLYLRIRKPDRPTD